MAKLFLLEVLVFWMAVHGGFGDDVPAEVWEGRFANTVDFMIEQVESNSVDAEILKFLPRKYKRMSFVKDKPHICGDQIGKDYCQYLQKFHACSKNKKRMSIICNKTCGFCKPPEPECRHTKFGCCHDDKTPAEGPFFKGCQESCLDIDGPKACEAYRRLGLCQKSVEKVGRVCQKTCSLCRPCEDETPRQCQVAHIYGLCTKIKLIMLNKCRRTCSFCGERDPCSSHTCPKDTKCVISPHGFPKCICNFSCTKGDTLTGTVCARDGKEYKNLCQLKKKNCNGKKVKVKRFGKCKPFEFMKGISCHKTKDFHRCNKWKKIGYCRSMKNRLAKYCPHVCGFCAAKASLPSCHYTKYGCCMDFLTPCKGPNYEGCKDKEKCTDKYKKLCERFTAACGEDSNRAFMAKYCPATCFFCPKR